MILSTCRKTLCLFAGKKSTSSPMLFWKHCKDMQTYFGYFGQTWLHTPKMIVSTCTLECGINVPLAINFSKIFPQHIIFPTPPYPLVIISWKKSRSKCVASLVFFASNLLIHPIIYSFCQEAIQMFLFMS